MSDRRYNLANLFYDEHCQRHMISVAARELQRLVEAQTEYSSAVIYGPMRKANTTEPSQCDLGGLYNKVTADPDYISLEYSYNHIKDFLFEINTSQQSYIVLTWVVLLFLYVCPRLRDIVAENTEPALFVPYFEKFETRFTVALCGKLIHKRDRKEDRSQIKIEAKPPIDIVLSERMRFDFIRSSPPPELYAGKSK